MRSPKAKGDAYEREVAAHFNAHLDPKVRLADFKRAVLSGGGVLDSGFDLTNTDIAPYGPRAGHDGVTRLTLGIEAKRTERLSVWEAWRQVHRHSLNARRLNPNCPPIIPMVVTRRNHTPTGASLVILSLDDFIAILNGRQPPPEPTTKNGGPKPPVSPLPRAFDFTRPLEQEG